MPPDTPTLTPPFWPPERGIFCNRTLNLRAMSAIGYDMDYTLVHYRAEEWERRTYETVRAMLANQGFPVADLEFDPAMVERGLIIDRELGNLVKANRFGYVKQASHGSRMLTFDEQRRAYSRVVIDLAANRFVFLNSLFSLSEAAIYCQLVDLLEAGAVSGVMSYDTLYERTRVCMDEAHLEGQLKAEIMADPERFVVPDPEAPQALLDQKAAGKALLLITNSEWEYTRFMMAYAYDPFLPSGMQWRDLFDLVIFSARKPAFFENDAPAFRLVDDAGLLVPCPRGITTAGVYAAGNAALVEAYLGCDGGDILFVGDHIYGDLHASKRVRRWRAALVLRELEDEMRVLTGFREPQERLEMLMAEKGRVEQEADHLRLLQLRHNPSAKSAAEASMLAARLAALRSRLAELDDAIGPLARLSASLLNDRWGLLMRTGNDKSHLARQIERHADVYTSRVSNFLFATPFAYFRSPRGSLPHDPGATPDPWDEAAASVAPRP